MLSAEGKFISLIYDGSFEGFLSCVFFCFEKRLWPTSITGKAHHQASLFGHSQFIPTEFAKSERVWRGLSKILVPSSSQNLFKAFLSEEQQIELHLFRYIKLAIESKVDPHGNFADHSILKIQQINKRINQEVHRMYAFVRFKKTLDGIFYAEIEPDFDVLPLISVHFEKRYADQQWLIYDVKRSYGIFYDIQSATTVMLEPFDENLMSGSKPANIMDGKEELYQILWQTYFNSVNVVERKNTKLQLRQMPKRYWKYLSELRRI